MVFNHKLENSLNRYDDIYHHSKPIIRRVFSFYSQILMDILRTADSI